MQNESFEQLKKENEVLRKLLGEMMRLLKNTGEHYTTLIEGLMVLSNSTTSVRKDLTHFLDRVAEIRKTLEQEGVDLRPTQGGTG